MGATYLQPLPPPFRAALGLCVSGVTRDKNPPPKTENSFCRVKIIAVDCCTINGALRSERPQCAKNQMPLFWKSERVGGGAPSLCFYFAKAFILHRNSIDIAVSLRPNCIFLAVYTSDYRHDISVKGVLLSVMKETLIFEHGSTSTDSLCPYLPQPLMWSRRI